MYSSVPPPEYVEKSVSTLSAVATGQTGEQESKPRHVHDHQWKKFLELRARREKKVSTGTARRIEQTRTETLRNVSQQLSKLDKDILREDGVTLPQAGRRGKRKWRQRENEREMKGQGEAEREESQAEADWKEVRGFMDPNPQLRGVPLGKYAPKSGLEEEMEACIERGEFEEAVKMSERLSQREFSSKVSTAFECRDYVKRKKIEEERKRKHKPPKLHWRFEPKQTWETKGNM